MGKWIHPCALIPAVQVERRFGFPVTGDQRGAHMLPTTSYLWGYDLYPNERILYVCLYEVGEAAGGRVVIGVEIFPNQQAAQTQMELYAAWLQSAGVQPIPQKGDLGEEVGFMATPSEKLVNAHLPLVYFSTVGTIVTANISGCFSSCVPRETDLANALALATQALADLPEDRDSVMPDQDTRLADAWQPSGKPIEPCELISREEAQPTMDNPISVELSNTYWGLAFGSAGVLQPHLSSNCSYFSSQSVSGQLEGVSLGIAVISDEDKEQYVTHSRDRNLREVPGIGEIAFRDPASDEDIVVMQGNLMVTVTVENRGLPGAQWQAADEFALSILSQLPAYDLTRFSAH